MRRRGFSLIEALLAIAAFSVFATGLISLFVYGRQGSVVSIQHDRAELLAREGVAAVRSIRDRNFASLSPGTYGLQSNAGGWQLVGSPDTTDGFTRTVVIASPETNLRRATVTISWQQTLQRNGSLSLATYVSNWRTAVVPPTSWANPVQQALINVSGNENGLKVASQGNYAYLVRVSGAPDFAVIDVTTPASPSQVGSLSLSGNPTNIAVSGNYAYVTTDDNAAELRIIDISTPSTPTIVGTLNLAGGADPTGIAVSGNFAYISRVSSGDGEFYIANISVPAAPITSGSLELTNATNEVAVSGNFAYVASATDTRELTIINVSNPALPVLTGSGNAAGTNDALSVVVYGSTAVVGRQGGAINIFNVSTPASPTVVGSYAQGSDVNDLAVDSTRNLLFAATNLASAEFIVLNVATLSSPSLYGSLNLANTITGVAFDSVKDRVYVTSTGDGNELLILRPGP